MSLEGWNLHCVAGIPTPTDAVYETIISVARTGLSARFPCFLSECFPCFLSEAFWSKAATRALSLSAMVFPDRTGLILDARVRRLLVARPTGEAKAVETRTKSKDRRVNDGYILEFWTRARRDSERTEELLVFRAFYITFLGKEAQFTRRRPNQN
jgi:hypothetical protein